LYEPPEYLAKDEELKRVMNEKIIADHLFNTLFFSPITSPHINPAPPPNPQNYTKKVTIKQAKDAK
jgi:hypothetical protein